MQIYTMHGCNQRGTAANHLIYYVIIMLAEALSQTHTFIDRCLLMYNDIYIYIYIL